MRQSKDCSPSAAERIGCVTQRTKVFRRISGGLKHGGGRKGTISDGSTPPGGSAP